MPRALITPKTPCRNVTWYDPSAVASRSWVTRRIIRRRLFLLVWETTMTKTLKAIAIASAVLVLWLPALGQTKFNPDGAFFNIGELPDGFKDFSGIYLNGRRLRRLPTQSL